MNKNSKINNNKNSKRNSKRNNRKITNTHILIVVTIIILLIITTIVIVIITKKSSSKSNPPPIYDITFDPLAPFFLTYSQVNNNYIYTNNNITEDTWNQYNKNNNYIINDMCYGNGKIIALLAKYPDNTNNYIYYYKNNQWIPTTVDSTYYQNISHSDKLFVVSDFENKGTIRESTDGINWTDEISLPLTNKSRRFIKLCSDNNNNYILYTDNGEILTKLNNNKWVLQNNIGNIPKNPDNPDNKWISMAYGKGKFICVSTSGYFAVSNDNGITWTIDDPLKDKNNNNIINYTDICYGNNEFIAITDINENDNVFKVYIIKILVNNENNKIDRDSNFITDFVIDFNDLEDGLLSISYYKEIENEYMYAIIGKYGRIYYKINDNKWIQKDIGEIPNNEIGKIFYIEDLN